MGPVQNNIGLGATVSIRLELRHMHQAFPAGIFVYFAYGGVIGIGAKSKKVFTTKPMTTQWESDLYQEAYYLGSGLI